MGIADCLLRIDSRWRILYQNASYTFHQADISSWLTPCQYMPSVSSLVLHIHRWYHIVPNCLKQKPTGYPQYPFMHPFISPLAWPLSPSFHVYPESVYITSSPLSTPWSSPQYVSWHLRELLSHLLPSGRDLIFLSLYGSQNDIKM